MKYGKDDASRGSVGSQLGEEGRDRRHYEQNEAGRPLVLHTSAMPTAPPEFQPPQLYIIPILYASIITLMLFPYPEPITCCV